MTRSDDFEERSAHLKNLSDEELDRRFWELVEQVVDPLVELARTHTSPSIERSVLLRMGFDSITAKNLVDKIFEQNLLGKGAGNVVYRFAKAKKMDYLDAGQLLVKEDHWDEVRSLFGVDKNGR
ncbi:ornithine aminomutase subunit alpha [Athalassotoga saccharophila]|uniref:ornithine aminomutase subunit alpha n=1 Tax=Athalassotoga saccharophila TaxID=1441386 RepID=UPI00137B8447|nr:ornithine aminomutase subunit alpha [Athalassotoga saccharophila]BBJ28092.1 D-ornithine 4,5-aminomutase subunit alpha [Athalassotoga saccharophila]